MASSPKAVPVPPPHVKISRSGRAYVDVGELVKGELERIEKSRQSVVVERPAPRDNNGNNNGQPREADASS